MKTNHPSFLSILALMVLVCRSVAAPDSGWLVPSDGESFGVVPVKQESASDGVFVFVEVPRTVPSLYSAAILDGTTVVGEAYPDWQYTGPRRFTGRARLHATGTRTLSLRLSDGFTITTIEGPTIHIVSPAPVPVFEQGSVSGITANSGTLRIGVNPRGAGYKNAAIEYGTTTAYGKSLRVYGQHFNSSIIMFAERIGARPDYGLYLATVLEPETEYHYRLVVDGVAGPDNVFVTAPNQPPVTREDVLVLDALGVGVPSCLSNDSDDGIEAGQMFGGGWWSLVSVSQPAHGMVEFSLDGSTIRYTAGATFEVTDEFFYTVRDRHGAEATGRVIVRNGAAHMAAVAGSYSTAVLDGTPKPIGSLDIQLSKTGHFTGVLVYYGRRFPISDRFILSPDYPQGLWTELELPRDGQPPLLLSFGIGYGYPDNFPTLTAGISTSDGEFNLPESPQLVPLSEQVPEAGQFNIAMANPNAMIDDNAAAPEEPDLYGVPQGNGFARMRVKRSGTVTVAGRMPDNRPFASGTRIRKDRKAMVNSKVGSDRRGSLYGIMGFSVLTGTGGDGDITWSNPERQTGFYRTEFTLTMSAAGKVFLPASGRAPALQFPVGTPHLARVIVRNHAGGIITDQTRIIDSRNRIMSDSGAVRKLQISLNPKTGLFSGKVLERGRPAIPLTGLLQPSLRRGVGISGKTGFEGTVEIIAL